LFLCATNILIGITPKRNDGVVIQDNLFAGDTQL
jgi:hypothetical protein